MANSSLRGKWVEPKVFCQLLLIGNKLHLNQGLASILITWNSHAFIFKIHNEEATNTKKLQTDRYRRIIRVSRFSSGLTVLILFSVLDCFFFPLFFSFFHTPIGPLFGIDGYWPRTSDPPRFYFPGVLSLIFLALHIIFHPSYFYPHLHLIPHAQGRIIYHSLSLHLSLLHSPSLMNMVIRSVPFLLSTYFIPSFSVHLSGNQPILSIIFLLYSAPASWEPSCSLFLVLSWPASPDPAGWPPVLHIVIYHIRQYCQSHTHIHILVIILWIRTYLSRSICQIKV